MIHMFQTENFSVCDFNITKSVISYQYAIVLQIGILYWTLCTYLPSKCLCSSYWLWHFSISTRLWWVKVTIQLSAYVLVCWVKNGEHTKCSAPTVLQSVYFIWLFNCRIEVLFACWTVKLWKLSSYFCQIIIDAPTSLFACLCDKTCSSCRSCLG